MSWHSIHVHYHDRDVDGLLLDAVRPLLADLAGTIDMGYYVRHWRRGPHLRLNLRAEADRFAEVIRPTAEQQLSAYLAARPSRATLDPMVLLPLHERLAELEGEPGPLLPWRPDNSLHIEPYDPRLSVWGSQAASDLRADYLARTTELAFAMTEHLRRGRQRMALAFDLMVAVAHALSGSHITRGFISYRSHAEGFLCLWPEGAGRREDWDRRYLAEADRLVERVRIVTDALDSGSAEVPFVSAWVQALRPFQARGRELIESGAMSMGFAAATSAAGPDTNDSPVAASPFHRKLLADDAFVHGTLPSVWFSVYRLMLNYNYLQLTRLGISPVERFFLCHLVANAVEERYGCSAMELIGQGAGSTAPTPGGQP